MNESLKAFKEGLQESLLNLLWQQWCICGVQGHAKEPGNWCIDPEILVLLTCSLGRREPRMFEEMLDLLKNMPGMINLQRLKIISMSNAFDGKAALRAVAGYIDKELGNNKWTNALKSILKSNKPEPLFSFKDGRPMENWGNVDDTFRNYGFLCGPVSLRGLVGAFDLRHPACLLLRLRSFVGTTSRSGICLYLCTHPNDQGENASRIAREIAHAQRVVQGSLVNMSKSGYVVRRENKRETHYAIQPEMRKALLQNLKEEPLWCNWITVGGFLEKMWLAFDDKKFLEADPMIQSIKLRDIVDDYRLPMSRSGLPVALDLQGHLEGEEYVAWVVEKVGEIIKVLITREKARE
jgi:hypothetical protein